MKKFGLIFLLLLTQFCFAQFNVTRLEKNAIPKNIKYTGNIVQSLGWIDSTGNNIIVITETGKTQSITPDDGSDGALYVYHFLTSNDRSKLTWKVYDYLKACPVDMFLYFIEKSFKVTDLDKDGKAEFWMMYKVSCQGDVSPVAMKLIMYEDDKKFAARGTTQVRMSETRYIGGSFSFDEAFKKGPVEFRKYAETLWNLYKKENWQQ